MPLPDTAARMTEQLLQPEVFGSGSLTDAVLKLVRDATSLDVKRNDMKLDMLPPHLFMNFRVVDEHGRQLGAAATWARSRASWDHRRAAHSRRWPGSRTWQRRRSRPPVADIEPACGPGRARTGRT